MIQLISIAPGTERYFVHGKWLAVPVAFPFEEVFLTCTETKTAKTPRALGMLIRVFL
jgi:hypothetical protein